MSISKLRETFEKKGCQVILVIIGILTAIGFLSTGQCSWLGARRANEPGETPIAKIGDVSIGERQYRAALESLRQNNQMPNVSPMMTARMQAAALQQLVESAYLLEMAKRMGVKTDDESLMKAVEENFDEQVKLYRQMMIAQNQLKPDATEEEFQAAVKKSQGADVSTLRERMVDQAKEALKDPAKRPMVVAQTLQPRLVQAYEAKVSVTPEVLKSQFDEISYQTIAITAPDGNWAKAKENAQKALDEIAAGAKFEDIHKKYGSGKIPTEVRPRSFFEGQKNFDAVAKAKPGEVVMVMVGAQPYLYRVEKITPKPPADFEQKKADYEKGYRQSQAYQLFQKDLESLKETKPPKWLMPGHEVLYEVAQAADDQELQTDLAKKRERMQELMEKAKQAEGDGMSEEAATLARFWAFSEYYGLLSPKEQEEQSDLKAEVLQRLLQFTESTDLRVELYDLYASENDWESAQEQLRLAAQNLTGFDDSSAQGASLVEQRLATAERAKKLTPEQVKEVRDEIARWRKERAQAEQDKADMAKEQAEIQKQLDEDAKRQAAEEQKLREQKAKAGPPTTGEPKAGEPKGGAPQTGEPKAAPPTKGP